VVLGLAKLVIGQEGPGPGQEGEEHQQGHCSLLEAPEAPGPGLGGPDELLFRRGQLGVARGD
jgi:hypothetical protein